MSLRRVYLKPAQMSADQRACFDLLCDLVGGEHHAPDKIEAFGRGIKCHLMAGRMATFDFNGLTTLVLLAHERCIRAEIISSGPGRIGLTLFKRHTRTGPMHSRHPTIAEAILSRTPEPRPKPMTAPVLATTPPDSDAP